MTKRIIDEWSDKYDFIVVFANTGLEHPKTLDFVHNCDTHFGFKTVWVEGVVHYGERLFHRSHRVIRNMEQCELRTPPHPKHTQHRVRRRRIRRYGRSVRHDPLLAKFASHKWRDLCNEQHLGRW